jgi:hypothetical protein
VRQRSKPFPSSRAVCCSEEIRYYMNEATECGLMLDPQYRRATHPSVLASLSFKRLPRAVTPTKAGNNALEYKPEQPPSPETPPVKPDSENVQF